MFWLLSSSFATLWFSLLVLRRPWNFWGQGGGRIRVAGFWIQFSRREVTLIFASLSTEELTIIRAGGSAAQEVLAAAAARYLALKERATSHKS